MRNPKEYLKQYKWLRKFYYKILKLTPKRLRFQNNLKKVAEFDKRNGTDFGGRMYWEEIGTDRSRANDYSPSPKDLTKTLKKMGISAKDAICDMGSGKGYAMFQMSRFPFGLIGGVELSEGLCKTAEINLKKVMPKNLKWRIYNCDAASWQDYDAYNIFYIYNSFPEKVMGEVNEKICESLEKHPRKVTVLYLYPEFPETFLKDKRWRLKERGNSMQLRYGMHIFENR